MTFVLSISKLFTILAIPQGRSFSPLPGKFSWVAVIRFFLLPPHFPPNERSADGAEIFAAPSPVRYAWKELNRARDPPRVCGRTITCTQWRRIGDHIPSQTIFSSKIADLTLVVSLCLTLATDGRIDTTSTTIIYILSYNTPWRSLKVLT